MTSAVDAGGMSLARALNPINDEPVRSAIQASLLPPEHPALFENLRAEALVGLYGTKAGAGLEEIVRAGLNSGRRPSGPELDGLYEVLAPFVRAVPPVELRASLPQVPFVELLPSSVPGFVQAVAPHSIEVFYTSNPSNEKYPGHTLIRVGNTVFEHFNTKVFELTPETAAQILSQPGDELVLGFGFGAKPHEIESLLHQFRTQPAPGFDWLSREAARSCNAFVTEILEKHAPRLGIGYEVDPLHMVSSMLWENPKLAYVTVLSKSDSPKLTDPSFPHSGFGEPLFADPGDHPTIARFGRIVGRKPVGYQFPGAELWG